MYPNLAIIAGSGQLPQRLASLYKGPVFVVAYKGITPESWINNYDHAWFSLGQVGGVIQKMHEKSIKNLVFAGGFNRPSLMSLIPDKEGLRLLAAIGLKWPGDDRILFHIHHFLEQEGFNVVSPQFIYEDLLAPDGLLTSVMPQPGPIADIDIGIHILNTTSPLDFGQGVAVQNGVVLAMEAAEGTTACILRSGLLGHPDAGRPVYIKRSKIGQSQIMDLPAIGVCTIKALVKAGFGGIAIQGKRTLLLDRQQMITMAQEAGLFIISYP